MAIEYGLYFCFVTEFQLYLHRPDRMWMSTAADWPFVVQSERLVVGVSNQSVSSVLQGAGVIRDPPAAGILCRPVRHW